MIILGIETSCDETAAAICSKGKILSSTITQQIIHSDYGGVIPEIASREHEYLLNKVVNHTLVESGIKLNELIKPFINSLISLFTKILKA